MTPFKINGKEYSMSLTMWDAVKVYPSKFHINLVSLFEENSLDSLLQRMYLGDELALELIEYYTKEDSDMEEILRNCSISDIKHFKDKWWEELMLFFDPLRRDFLKDVLRQAPKLIANQLKNSVEALSKGGSSNSLESPE